MKASKKLSKPENWQDFETLCKKLWGEIWQCAEIKKNGRSGQNQNGVDVYGIPVNQQEYFGIQCKGKDEYTQQQLTKDEIEREIEKAKNFQPPLKKFYFATTAVKDVNIEAFVRQKNIEHLKTGIFEVHLFCWEDIVELIHENQQTYDYYVNSINFNNQNSVKILFENESDQLIAKPKFYQRVIEKRINTDIKPNADFHDTMIQGLLRTTQSIKRNYSQIPIRFKICNTGSTPIENYKLEIEFIGEIESLAESDIVTDQMTKSIFAITNPVKSYSIYGSKVIFTSRTFNDMIVGGDKRFTEFIYLKPKTTDSTLKIRWKLLSKNLQSQGELTITINVDIIKMPETRFVDSPQEVGIENEIIDCIESKSHFDYTI